MTIMPENHTSWSKMFDEKMLLKEEVASLEAKIASFGTSSELREADMLVEIEQKKRSLAEITKRLRSVS